MDLATLDGQFIRYNEDKSLHEVNSLAEAQGIMFICPICSPTNGHSVMVSFAGRGVPDHLGSHNDEGKPSRWAVSGNGYADLTLTPSIWLKGIGCGWHGFITNGDVK